MNFVPFARGVDFFTLGTVPASQNPPWDNSTKPILSKANSFEIYHLLTSPFLNEVHKHNDACNPTDALGAWWDFMTLSLYIDSCTVSTDDTTWEAVKSFYK